jgi:hypothetical protein
MPVASCCYPRRFHLFALHESEAESERFSLNSSGEDSVAFRGEECDRIELVQYGSVFA